MRLVCFLLSAMLLLPQAALASRERRCMPECRPLTGTYIIEAARAYKLPPAALVGILATEGGKMGEALSNANGTWDLGAFQINTCNLDDLAEIGFTPKEILCDGRVNAFAAAWLLHREYRRTGNLWQAIGAYHSRTPHLRDAYIRRVKHNLANIRKTGVIALLRKKP